MEKDSYYFPHDSNARNDIKMIKVRRKYKFEGYGLYFALVEILREQKGYKLPLSNIPDIAYDLGVTEQKLTSIIKDFDLFIIDGDNFYTTSLIRRMQKFDELKIKRIEAGRKGGQASVKQRLTDGQAVKDTKGNKRKQNKFIAPSLDEFLDYFLSNGFSKDVGVRAWSGYNEANWFDSQGNEIKNWKTKCQNVWFTNENKIPAPVKKQVCI